MKKHNADQYESIKVQLNEKDHPIAFEIKVKELMKSGLSKDKAEKYLKDCPIELEIYYSTDQGLFGVEAEAVECCEIHNPYDGELMEDPEQNF